jgi:hypothetical protein
MNPKELDICFSLKEITAPEEIRIVRISRRVSSTRGKASNTLSRIAARARAEHSNFVLETVETVLERFRFTNLKAVSYSVIKNRFGPTLDNISHQLARIILRRRDELLYAEKRSQLAQYNGFFYRERS